MNILKLLFDPIINRMIFTKKNLLKSKKETILGMILDKEIEVEVNWLLLRRAEKDLEKTKKKIEENCSLVGLEKAKEKMDLEKVKKLVADSVSLGLDKIEDDGKISFQSYTSKNPKRRTQTMFGQFENRIESQKAGITQAVFQREMLKHKLRGINNLIKGGFQKDFDRFRNEKLDFVLED